VNLDPDYQRMEWPGRTTSDLHRQLYHRGHLEEADHPVGVIRLDGLWQMNSAPAGSAGGSVLFHEKNAPRQFV
jgi:hypothetical protein